MTSNQNSGPALQEPESIRDVAISRLSKFANEALCERMIGFALSRCWVFAVFFNSSMLLDRSMASETVDSIYAVSLLSLVIGLTIAGTACNACESLFKHQRARFAPAFLSFVGTLMIPFCSANSTAGIFSILISGVTTGLGSGLLVVMWGDIYGRLGGSISIAESLAGYLLAALPIPMIHVLPPAAQLMIVCALPVASNVILVRERRSISRCPDADDLSSETSDGKADLPFWTLETVNLSWISILVKLALSSLAFGCVISIMRSTFADNGIGTLNDGFNSALPGIAFVAALVCLLPLLFAKNLDLAYTYKPILLLMTLGCVLLPIFGTESNISRTVTMAGYICFEIMNWAILSDICFRFGMPRCRVYGFGRAATSGGVLFGAILGALMNSSIELSTEFITALSFTMIFAMVVTYTFTLTERDVAKITRQRARRPYEPRPEDSLSPILTIEDKAALLAERHDITGRSLEVLMLLSRGRSATRIEQELYMSKGTVNTHMRRIYQKLGIHTKQELLDLVDETKPDGE